MEGHDRGSGHGRPPGVQHLNQDSGGRPSVAADDNLTVRYERPADNDGGQTGAWEADQVRQDQFSTLRFDALRNAYYHSARQRFFEWQHRWLMFGIVVTGTAGVANVLEKQAGAQWFSAITALLAALDLVLDLRGKAQLHDHLKQRYYGLLAKLQESPDASVKQISQWQAKILKITAEEPVTYRAVDAVAHNEATDTLGLNTKERLTIGRWRYRTRHWIIAQGTQFLYERETDALRDTRRLKRKEWTMRQLSRIGIKS